MTQWDIDRRPLSLYTRIYVVGMKLRRDKQAFEGSQHTLQNAEQLQEAGDVRPTLLTRLLTRVERIERGSMTTWRVTPRQRQPKVSVIYVHGGGYVHPLTPDYWRLARTLVRTPADVIVPCYPLVPGATIDDVLPLLLQLHAEVSRDKPDHQIVLMGDSAGGALVLAMAHKLAELDGRLPTAVVALCPWLDATLQDPRVSDLDATDPMLAASGLRAAGRSWAGPHQPADPLVSPVNIDLTTMPPIDVFIGGYDILRPAVDTFAEHATQSGAELHVHEVAAMFHVWMTRALPEARRTRRKLVQLLRERTA